MGRFRMAAPHLMGVLAAILTAVAITWTGADHAFAQAPAWQLTAVTPADRGTTGARWPALSADGTTIGFAHDGDLTTPGGPGNPDANPEIWTWSGGVLTQLTATTRAGGRTPVQSVPSLDRGAARAGFLSTADFDGTNADGSPETWVWQAGATSSVSTSPTGAAEGAALSADGRWMTFWHGGDLAGTNPGGGLELYRAQIGQPPVQLTNLTGTPYHDLPAISADGTAIAFIVDADLTGDNADGSWELFLWEDRAPGPGQVTQITHWAPPMTGREIYHPSISGDGRRVAFAGRGQVDASLQETHTEIEIYLWTAPDRLQRVTRASTQNASSLLPRITDDGGSIAFVSLSDLTPGAPGNPERIQELFIWRECEGFSQATAGVGRQGILANIPDLRPGVDGRGAAAAFVSESVTDPHPLALASRRGILVSAVRSSLLPCAATATPTPTVSSTSTASPTATAGPTSTPGAGRVCPQVAARIPSAVQARALIEPERFYGWNVPANPGLPPGYNNPPRRWLSIRDPGKPYGPVNPAVWKVGCP